MKNIRVDNYLLNLLASRTMTISPAMLFVAGGLVIFLRNYIPTIELLIWFILIMFPNIIRYTLLYWVHKNYTKKPDLPVTNKLIKQSILLLYIIESLVWTYAVIFFLIPENPVMVASLYASTWAVIIGLLFMSTSYAKNYIYSFPIVLSGLIWSTASMATTFINVIVVYINIPLAAGFLIWISLVFQKNDREKATMFFENKDLSERLKTKKDTAEMLNQEKTQVLASASHDLKQPVQSLKLLIHALKKKDTSNSQLVSDLESSILNLGDLLENILDLSHLDSGKTKIEKYPTHIQELFSQLQSDFALRTQKKGLVLKVFPINSALNTDPILFYRLLSNILDNAVKYTNEGSVILQASETNNEILIEVIDTGIGIPQDSQKDIFTEFKQLKNQDGSKAYGFGLGLSICSRLSTLLGHNISVKSEPGVGSVFSIRAEKAQAQLLFSEKVHESIDLKGSKILVIDSNKETRSDIRKILESHEAIVLEATTSSETGLILSTLKDKIAYLVCGYDIDSELLNSVISRLEYEVPVILLVNQPNAHRYQNIPKNYTLVKKDKPALRIVQAIQQGNRAAKLS